MGFRFFVRFLYFERTRPTASTGQPCLMYLSTSTGVRTGCHYLISLSLRMSVCQCVPVSVCVTFVVFLIAKAVRGRFSQTRDFMEAGEYRLTRGTRFVARRLGLVAVAGRLWVSWCVLGRAGFFCVFLFSIFFFLRTHTACCKYEAALPHSPLC